MEKNKTLEEFHKNLNKYGECTKCQIIITRDKYKKDRTICGKCLCKYMVEYNSIKLDRSNKQDRPKIRIVETIRIDRLNRIDQVNSIVRINSIVQGDKLVLGNKLFLVKQTPLM